MPDFNQPKITLTGDLHSHTTLQNLFTPAATVIKNTFFTRCPFFINEYETTWLGFVVLLARKVLDHDGKEPTAP